MGNKCTKFSCFTCSCTVICHGDGRKHDHGDGDDHCLRCRQTRRRAESRASVSNTSTEPMPRQREDYTAPAHHVQKSRGRTPDNAHPANPRRHQSPHQTQNHPNTPRPMSPAARPTIPNRSSSLAHGAVMERQRSLASFAPGVVAQEYQTWGAQPVWGLTPEDLPHLSGQMRYEPPDEPRPGAWNEPALGMPNGNGEPVCNGHVSDSSPSSTASHQDSEEGARTNPGPPGWFSPYVSTSGWYEAWRH